MEKLAVEVAGKKRSRKKVAVKDEKSGGSAGESHHEMHIWTERERRKRMRNMFSALDKLTRKADKSSIVDEAVKYIKTLEHTLRRLEKHRMVKHLGCNASTSTINRDQVPSLCTESHDHDPEVLDQSRESILADNNYQGRRQANNYFHKPRENTALLTVLPVLSDATDFQTWFSRNAVVDTCRDDAQISICSTRKPKLLTTIFYMLEKHNLEVISAHIFSDLYRSIYMIHAHVYIGGASAHFGETLSVEDIIKLAAGEMNLWILSCN